MWLREITSETGTPSPSRVAPVTATPKMTVLATLPVHFNTEDFVMGPDTCGFTSGNTITCTNPTDYCMNIGDYRGCCAGGIDQCSATVYTTCQEGLDNAYEAHVLYCTGDSPACMTHYYTTEDIPGHTYTNVACGTSDLFGQLFPYPPELMPTTSAQPINSTTLSSDSDSTESESRPVPTGAIVGAIVAAIILVIFLITATVCFARRKRSQAHLNTSAAKAAAHGGSSRKGGVKPVDALPAVVPSGSGGNSEAAEVERKRRLRLSTIPEVLSPTSPTGGGTGNAMFRKSKSKSARRSYGPDWPLGSADPLESHPMPLPPPPPPPSAQNTPDPEKSAAAGGEQPQTPQTPRRSIPTLNLFAASPTAKSHKRTASASTTADGGDNLKVSPITPDSARVMLQSPRLSYHPVSPMDAAFNDEVERRVSRLEGAGPTADTNEQNNRSGEVSPIDDDDDDVDARHPLDNRLSLISVPTVSEDGARLDDIVSPVSPQEEEHEEKKAEEEEDVTKKEDEVEEAGDVSPMSVSPIESRRSSLRK